MRAAHEVQIGDCAVTVKELTVGETRAWLVNLGADAERPIDLVDAVLLDGVSLTNLALMSQSCKKAECAVVAEVLVEIDIAGSPRNGVNRG